MPIYEYICKQCGAHGEVIQKTTDSPLAICEKCGGEVYRPISRTSFQLKGGGWYKDGYGSPAPSSTDTTEKKPDTKPDSSPTTTPSDTPKAPPPKE